jgi:hypothetical protein
VSLINNDVLRNLPNFLGGFLGSGKAIKATGFFQTVPVSPDPIPNCS